MVLASAASFGTLPVLVKFAYSTGLTPLQALTYRFLLGALGLHVLALLRGEPAGLSGRAGRVRLSLAGRGGSLAGLPAPGRCSPGGGAGHQLRRRRSARRRGPAAGRPPTAARNRLAVPVCGLHPGRRAADAPS